MWNKLNLFELIILFEASRHLAQAAIPHIERQDMSFFDLEPRQHLATVITIAAIALGALACSATQTQSYPSRPMRMIVPFAPGGAADILARSVAEPMAKDLGQPILIINRDGAGTLIGLNEAAHASTDGYTLLLSGDAGVINAASGRKLPYDLLRDLAPISIVYSGAQIMMGRKDSPHNTLPDMVKYAKANPDKLRFGSASVGTSIHLSSEIFNQAAGIKAAHIPYKGVAPAMNDLAGGHIEYVIGGSTAAIPAIRNGLFRGLAIMSRQRSPELPDLPTAIEQGINAETGSWYGLFTRAGAPPEVLRKLHAVLMTTLASPQITERFRSLGGEPRSMTTEQFRTYLRDEIQKLAKLMKQLNIKPDD